MTATGEAKNEVRRLLESPDLASEMEAGLARLAACPAKAVVRALLAGLSSPRELERWRAAELLGVVATRLAQDDLEAAREVMRRLIWSLNPESGAMGWGAAEAMAEVMARHEGLAGEFASIYLCYAAAGPRHLENPHLLKGAAWGLGRLAQARPDLARELGLAAILEPLLAHPDPGVRGLAAWSLGMAGAGEARPALQALVHDRSEAVIYAAGRLSVGTVGELAEKACET